MYTPQRECPDSTSNLAFGIERAALPLFGFANFGCLLTGELVLMPFVGALSIIQIQLSTNVPQRRKRCSGSPAGH